MGVAEGIAGGDVLSPAAGLPVKQPTADMKKGVQTERLDYYFNLKLPVFNCTSLSDAEAGEDGGEDFGGGDGAGDGAEVVEGLADVLGDEVAGEGVGVSGGE